MRILLAAGVDVSLPGGLETHVLELAAGLGARGHDVCVFGRATRPAPPLAAGAAGEAASRPLPPIVDRIEPARYDVVHHHGSAWPGGCDPGPRYVRTLHFCTAAKMATYVRMGRLRTLAHPGNWRGVVEEWRAVRRRGRLIAVASRVARDCGRFYGLDPARAAVIPNGASFAGPAEPRDALRLRYGIGPDAFVLLTVGRDDFVKGHGLLARAWEGWRERPAEAVWVSVGGKGPSREGSRVVTGTVTRDEVTSWIHAADLGAMPSYYEGCSLALLDMLAGGLFVLAHDVGNADEVIVPGGNGRLVEPDERAWRAALSEALARRPRGSGLDRGFDWSAIVERVERVYREVAAV